MRIKLSKTIILLIVLFASSCLFSIIRLLVIPSDRVGFFGIGLPAKMITYGDSSSNFAIEYPESWIIHESSELESDKRKISITINVPGRSFPKVEINPISISVNNISEIVEYGKREISDLPNYSEIFLEPFSTPYYQGVRREYSWTVATWLGRVMLRCEDYYFIQELNGYVATFCVEDKHWQIVKEVFRQMMSTLIIN